jgi:hypothetical protein
MIRNKKEEKQKHIFGICYLCGELCNEEKCEVTFSNNVAVLLRIDMACLVKVLKFCAGMVNEKNCN